MNEKPNYAYWQETGTVWPQEYGTRKKSQLYYHLEEMLLAIYMERSAPADILEFGCGYGRHLRYLTNIRGIRPWGYDQSPTMLEGIKRWARPEWIRSHIALGSPNGSLPYLDASFDIVFTAEVMVHVHPDDLQQILEELVRIANWQIIHIETAPWHRLVPDEHGGCWNHDLRLAYEKLGYECVQLPAAYATHAPYRVVIDRDRPLYTWPDVLLELMRRAEADIQASLDQSLSEIASSAKGLSDLNQRLGDCEKALKREQEVGEALIQNQERLEAHLLEFKKENEALANELAAARQFQHSISKVVIGEDDGRASRF